MIIGVDADGVLVNMHEFNLREGKRYFKKEPVNSNAYSPKDMFGVSSKEEFLYGLKVFNKYCKSEPPMADVVEVITDFASKGYELHEITARKFTTYRNFWGAIYRRMFRKWLKRHNLSFRSIQFCSETYSPRDKLMACMKLDVDVMIEDKAEVAMFLAENGVQVLLFDAPYNQEIEHKNITRIYSWKQIHEIILRMKKDDFQNAEFVKLSGEERQKLDKGEQIGYLKNYKKFIKGLDVNRELIKKNKRSFRFLYSITKIPFSVLFHSKIEGKENIPYQDGFIIASNHLNSYDQFYISRALGKRQFYGLAASTVNETVRGKLFNMLGSAVYIDRNDKASKEKGEEELVTKLVNDQIVLIFPEGTRKNKTEAGKKELLLPFKLGAVSMAQKTGAGILPISLYFGKKKYLKIGELIFVKPEDDLVEVNKKLEKTIAEMTMESKKADSY